jgi:hypothetical protein
VDQTDIVRCCICKEAKDIDDTDQCDVCLQYVCHWCGVVEEHKCIIRKLGVNFMKNNKGQTLIDYMIGAVITAIIFVIIIKVVETKLVEPVRRWANEHYRSDKEIHRDISDLFERQELATSLRRCLDEQK